LPEKAEGGNIMTKLENNIASILERIRPKLAESSYELRKAIFDQLIRMASKMSISEPCQELYDAFYRDDHGSKQRKSMHCQIIKMLDFEAGTQCITVDGVFYNELPLPSEVEAEAFASSCTFPLPEQTDIGILIAIAALEMKPLKLSASTMGQYHYAWREIRAWFFITSNMAYHYDLIERYLRDNDSKRHTGEIKEWKWKIQRKAICVLKEVSITGHFQWKNISCYKFDFADEQLEAVHQEYITHLNSENLSASTIDIRNYVFRKAFSHGDINDILKMNMLTGQDIQKIVKEFSRTCSLGSLSTIIPIFRSIINYLYKGSYIKNDYSGIILKPFYQRNNVAGYISQEDEDRLHKHLEDEPLRNRAIMLLGLKLGLRNKDICCLTLRDIDWKNDLIRLNQHKNGKPLILPLTAEVGNALMDYLLKERPTSRVTDTSVFLRRQAPYRGIQKTYHTCRMVIDHLGIVPVNGTGRGTHLLRYTFVNRLLKVETPHQVITDALGHTTKESDKNYITMEASMLRQCAIGLNLIGKKHWKEGDCNENT
jgi:integrase